MPQTRQNGAVVPVGSDPYNPPGDFATLADSLNVNVPIANLAERNALTPHEGMTIVRLDLKGIIEVYINGAWAGSGATAVATFGGGSTGWTPLTGGHLPRLYRSGGMVFLVGGVTRGAAGVNNILTVDTQFRPSTTDTVFVGAGVASSQAAYELALFNGVLSIPSTYLTGNIPEGSVVSVTCQWPLF